MEWGWEGACGACVGGWPRVGGEGEDRERKGGPGQKLRGGELGGRPGWRGWGLVWVGRAGGMGSSL